MPSVSPDAIKKAQDQLDAHVREIVQWHLNTLQVSAQQSVYAFHNNTVQVAWLIISYLYLLISSFWN